MNINSSTLSQKAIAGYNGSYSERFKTMLQFQSMNDKNYTILNQNVRGLNGTARRQVVHDLVADHRGTVICLQETKLFEGKLEGCTPL